jgi:negative regulator of sigma E activity
MDKEISYKMSLLLDGELTAQETVTLWKNIEQDPAMAKQWQRYNQVRSAMNSLPPIVAGQDFVSSVHQALLLEPTVMLPNRQSKAKNTSQQKIVMFRRTGMVAASAVLALMVYGGYQQQLQQTMPAKHQPSTADILTDNVVADSTPIKILTNNVVVNNSPAEIASDNILAGNASVEILDESVDTLAPQIHYSSSQIPTEKVFNDYLVTHGDYSYANSPQPLISGARIISYNAE